MLTIFVLLLYIPTTPNQQHSELGQQLKKIKHLKGTKMFNLYKDAIDQNGFMGLINKNSNSSSVAHETHSRKIISGFAIASLTIVAVMTKGAEIVSYATTTVV